MTTTSDMISSAIRAATSNLSEVTADDLRAAADYLRTRHAATMDRIADALDASADDMDRPVRLSDVLATYSDGTTAEYTDAQVNRATRHVYGRGTY